MPCCGGKREELRARTMSHQTLDAFQGATSLPQAVSPGEVYFEYLGRTRLTVLGPITGRRYSFDGPGAIVPVDGRDEPSVAAVPNLRWVKHLV